VIFSGLNSLWAKNFQLFTFDFKLILREGCGGRRSRHCPERSEGIVRHLSFLSRCSRMCFNYYLSTFAEAKAKPVAARPERSGTATSEGHAQINKKRILNICASKDTPEKQRKNGCKFIT